MELGLQTLPKTYSATLYKLNIHFILPFQTLQFELFRGSLVCVMAMLLMIATQSIDSTVTMMLAFAGAWAPPTGDPGMGINGLVAPVAMLPWSNIGACNRGRC